jgi:hypothetical protein
VAYRTPWWILAQTWQERGIRWKSGTRPCGTRNNKHNKQTIIQINFFGPRLKVSVSVVLDDPRTKLSISLHTSAMTSGSPAGCFKKHYRNPQCNAVPFYDFLT